VGTRPLNHTYAFVAVELEAGDLTLLALELFASLLPTIYHISTQRRITSKPQNNILNGNTSNNEVLAEASRRGALYALLDLMGCGTYILELGFIGADNVLDRAFARELICR
jgi:hypothetical protein